MEKIFKALLIFWGIIISVTIIKFVIPILPKDFTFISNLSKKEETTNKIYLPIKEQYGFSLKNTKGCIQDYKSSLQENNENYSTFSTCFNDLCHINITFEKKIPTKIKLYVQENNDCILKTYEVPKNLEVSGYYVDFNLTDSQKKKLNIHDNDKIRLAKTNGHSITQDKKLYFYNERIEKDDILVNDTVVGQIFFNKKMYQNQVDLIQEAPIQTKIIEKNDEVEIEIPHPKELFTILSCNDDLLCKMKSNTYIVNVDGVYFIPPKEFILTCLENIKSNKFCTFFTPMGKISTPKFNSKSQMNRYLKGLQNPERNNNLEEWQKQRLIQAKEKIINSLQ